MSRLQAGCHLVVGSKALPAYRDLSRWLTSLAVPPLQRIPLYYERYFERQQLRQELASSVGEPGSPILAGVEFLPLSRLSGVGADDAWGSGNLVWRCLEQLATLPTGLAPSNVSELDLARTAARLFTHYDRDAPELLAAWLDETQDHWQAQLYRRLVRTSATEPPWRRLAAATAAACEENDTHLPLVIWQPGDLTEAEINYILAVGSRRHVRIYVTQFAPGSSLETLHPAHLWVEALLSEADSVTRLEADPPPETLLAALQADEKHEADPSLQAHGCHGIDRQIEVARDEITRAFQQIPGLAPHEVCIAVEGLPAFWPMLSAAFSANHPANTLRLARQTAAPNPYWAFLRQLMELPQTRVTRSQLLSFCANPLVAERFELTEDAFDRLERLAETAAITWGLDAGHRQDVFGVASTQGTWEQGLARLTNGLAVDASALETIPIPALNSTLPTATAGADTTEAITGVAACWQVVRDWRLAGPASIATWAARWRDALETLTRPLEDQPWVLSAVESRLLRLEQVETSTPLSPLEAYETLVSLDDSGRIQSVFGSGEIAVADLRDVGSAAYRVTCILGLGRGPDEAQIATADDLAPKPSMNSVSRCVAKLVANTSDRCLIVLQTQDPIRGHEVQLIGAASETVSAVETATGLQPADWLTQHHLQPHHVNYYSGALPRSFDPAGLQAASVQPGSAPARDRFAIPDPVEIAPEPLLETTELAAFFAAPIRHLFGRRAKLWQLPLPPARVWESDSENDPEGARISWNALASWQLRRRLLSGLIFGRSQEHLAAAEWGRGELVSGPRAMQHLDNSFAAALRAYNSILELSSDYATADTADCTQVGDTRVCMMLPGSTPTLADIGRATMKRRLQLWLAVLVHGAATEGAPVSGLLITDVARLRVTAPPADRCRELLAAWVAGYHMGATDFFPVPLALAEHYAEKCAHGVNLPPSASELRRLWWRGVDDYEKLVFPGGIEQLLNHRVAGTDFAHWVRELYVPMLAADWKNV